MHLSLAGHQSGDLCSLSRGGVHFSAVPPYGERQDMELRDLVERVGEERFAQARAWSWRTAAGTGQSRTEPTGVRPLYKAEDVPHDLEEVIWTEGEAPWIERVSLAFRLYREMPCYAVLMYTTGYFSKWDESTRGLFWDEYRALISEADDRLADPGAYSLWCDYFEDPKTVKEAWDEIAQPGSLSERGLERVLEVSGPVPFRLKVALYEELVTNERWHLFIFRGLLHSAVDVFGDLDAKAGKRLLSQLSLPKDTGGLGELKARLSPPAPER